MALFPIVKYGDPVLRNKTTLVPEITDPLRETIRDMFKTMYAAPGIGLAANQVGLSQCFAVIDIQPGGQKRPIVIINPVIEDRSGKLHEEEGCLSIPEFYEMVSRPSEVKVRYLDRQGEPQEILANGVLATCVQHEIDHLNGVLFIDYISKLKRDRVVKKFVKAQKLGKL